MKKMMQPFACLGMLCLICWATGQETPPVPARHPGITPETACHNAMKFLIRESLVKRGAAEFPGTIAGELLHGCERIRSGWLLYLYVSESAVGETGVEIKLDMKKVRLVISTLELLTGERFPGYELKMTIPPGQFRILYVRTESFEPDYEQYFE